MSGCWDGSLDDADGRNAPWWNCARDDKAAITDCPPEGLGCQEPTWALVVYPINLF
jgi:hypothetical protein